MIPKNILVAPSILSANFANIKSGVDKIVSSGGDWIHLDVMDGHFVPNLTFGNKMVEDIKPLTTLPLDVHLMVEKPESFIDSFIRAGPDYITFHYEAAVHHHRIIQSIKDRGVKTGLSIVPSTPTFLLSDILSSLDIILIMSVNPGFGGQSFLTQSLEKIQWLDSVRKEKKYSFLISVDGGVNRQTADMIKDAGADVLVTGSSFFNAHDPKDEIRLLKGQKWI